MFYEVAPAGTPGPRPGRRGSSRLAGASAPHHRRQRATRAPAAAAQTTQISQRLEVDRSDVGQPRQGLQRLDTGRLAHHAGLHIGPCQFNRKQLSASVFSSPAWAAAADQARPRPPAPAAAAASWPPSRRPAAAHMYAFSRSSCLSSRNSRFDTGHD